MVLFIAQEQIQNEKISVRKVVLLKEKDDMPVKRRTIRQKLDTISLRATRRSSVWFWQLPVSTGSDGHTHKLQYRIANSYFITSESFKQLRTYTCEKMRNISFILWTPYLVTGSEFYKTISAYFKTYKCLQNVYISGQSHEKQARFKASKIKKMKSFLTITGSWRICFRSA